MQDVFLDTFAIEGIAEKIQILVLNSPRELRSLTSHLW